MKTQCAIDFFGGSAALLAKALKITPGAVSQWGEDVPALRAYQLAEIMASRPPAPPMKTRKRGKAS